MSEPSRRPDVEALRAASAVLEAIVADRGVLAQLDAEERRALLMAAGRVSRPDRAELRDLAKALRKRERDERRAADEALLDATEMRSLRRAPIFPTPEPPVGETDATEPPRTTLREARKCYVCKAPFQELHFFYDQLCPACARLNYAKRTQTCDLRGRVVLITGARVKIGYHAAIKLLRAGARVLVTTRFPRDAAQRFAQEPDFADFAQRLSVYGLDLVHTPSVERFAQHLLSTCERLDHVVHNACQTVRKPPQFYAHLLETEHAPVAALPRAVRALLEPYEDMRARAELPSKRAEVPAIGLAAPAVFTQLAHAFDDVPDPRALFPEGERDQDAQQIDLREHNSWRMTLAEVPTLELLEVLLVNATAPFVLNARLKPLLVRTPERDKHIVNVSAMEGKFVGHFKTDKHPHTNMAKAALNMMTRTSAAEYVRDGIHMNSVDTGWVTDEDPRDITVRKRAEHGFHPPLDVVDGAARIVDPIFHGALTGEHVWGKFLKDYAETEW